MYEITHFTLFWSKSADKILDRFLKKDFGHVQICFSLKNDESVDNPWFAIHSTGRKFKIYQLTSAEFYEKTRGLESISVSSVTPEFVKPAILPCLPTCVTLVKRLLNIKAWWVITPFQLYRYMKKHYK